jgi:hypothetical protein
LSLPKENYAFGYYPSQLLLELVAKLKRLTTTIKGLSSSATEKGICMILPHSQGYKDR